MLLDKSWIESMEGGSSRRCGNEGKDQEGRRSADEVGVSEDG